MPRATPKDDPQPVPPVQPDLDDCCHSGCNPCVFDLYDEALERYQSALAEWQARQAALRVQKVQKVQKVQTVQARHSKPRTRR
ncbi:oxidoreductase-like domain-containing protein [Paraburkholderia aspalathi]|uniref:oxidoreductase-like domain-containing protein n=1 Tax=Paraburkholderia aspalathi TaxID=1324617 RepID=UPI000A71E93F|nr:oxidoreductase-like domain-containing protein [Paraburkholderia aspalathi]